MSESTIKILVAIFGLVIGFYWRRTYRRYKRWRQRNWLVAPGDRITIVSSKGEKTVRVKKVKRSTITIEDRVEELKRKIRMKELEL